MPLTDARRVHLRRELEDLLGRGGVLSQPDELLTYESDGLTLFRALADFVVFPQAAEQVAEVVKTVLAVFEQVEQASTAVSEIIARGCWRCR